MKKTNNIPFSVCMSVYKKDNPTDVLTALRSISTAQTVQPTEIILVVDGPIPKELDKTINDFSKGYATLTLLRLKVNQGPLFFCKGFRAKARRPFFCVGG